MMVEINQTKKPLLKRWWFWVLVIPLFLAVIFFSLMYYTMNWHFFAIDKEKVPEFIQAHFVNLDEVQAVSKYRSGVGHDASFDGETCRSMRHYHGFLGTDENAKTQEEKAKLRFDTFAPVDGRIMNISGGKSGNDSQQLNIRPDNKAAHGIEVRIDNLRVDPSLKAFSHIKAGQKIGESMGMAEITIAYHWLFGDMGFSYIKLLPDHLFADYQKAAGTDLTRDDFVITKEYRDAHPLQCEDTWSRDFVQTPEATSHYNNIYMNGFIPNEYRDDKIDNKKSEGIVDFETCAKVYPVLETYPEQCKTPDGRTYTKEL